MIRKFKFDDDENIKFMNWSISPGCVIYRETRFSYFEVLSCHIEGIKNRILFNYDKKAIGLVIGLFRFNNEDGKFTYNYKGKSFTVDCLEWGSDFFVLRKIK